MELTELYGREITKREWHGHPDTLLAAESRPGFKKVGRVWECVRCGNGDPEQIVPAPCSCGEECFYCAICLNMGRIKRCSTLYSLPEANAFPAITETLMAWEGTLSSEQERASRDVVAAVRQRATRLIWAVAGSGKTEMIFQGIADCLRAGGRVAIASPRVDVCLELAPRIRAAFPKVPLALLHGAMEAPYCYTPLVIATTHQLLRFREAFDLLIIDEVDSFPYHNDRALQYGAEKARKKESALLYLTATPSRDMQRQAGSEKLAVTVLPARYHGWPLPEARCVWVGDWRRDLIQRRRRAPFLKLLEREFQAGRRFLLFMPQISLMEELEAWLHELYPEKSFTSVSAEDPERIPKVLQMRAEAYEFLLTTTILERGVTFRDIDVIVLGPEDPVFTEASLVQIAGRVGRHKDFPGGLVCFAHFGYTRAIKRAVHQIKRMNRLAREGGLLHGELPALQPKAD